MIHRILRIAALSFFAAATVTVYAAPCPTTSVTPATAIPLATVGANYLQSFGASNSNALPFVFSITSGLPAGTGLAMSTKGPSTGNFFGVPQFVGNFFITVTATDSSGCSGGRTYTLIIGQGSQTLNFNSTPPSNPSIGSAPYNVSATASSGLAVAYSIDASASAVCSIVGTSVSFIGNGTCVINANQAGNANYTAAPQAQQSFVVSPANQSISFTSVAPTAATISGTPYVVAATATSGLPVAFTIDASAAAVCSIAGSSVSFQAAGTCVINANQAGNAGFNAAPQVQQSFLVNKVDQAITYTSTAPGGAVVGGPSYEVAATASSALAVTITIDASAASVCSISGSTVSFVGAGSCVINANQAGDATYNAASQAQQIFTVAQASQTISFTSTAPTGASVGGSYTVTATATSGLAVSFSIDASASGVCSIAGSTVSFTAGGTCVINANQVGDSNWLVAPQVQQIFAVSNCITLAVGQVVLNTMPGGANICVVNDAGGAAEYTYLPINNSSTTDASLSVTGTGIVAVTGPPAPRPADDALPLAPLQDAPIDVHAIQAPGAFPAGHTYDASDLVHPNGGVVPLVVGQLIDLNTSIGACGIAPDVRKGRVEAITPAVAGQQRLYAVQEVIETTAGANDWHPPLAGAFPSSDFQNIIDAFVQTPPGSTPAASFSATAILLKSGAMTVATTNFGALSDVDNNGGVIVFYTRKLNELSPPASSGAALGLFQSRDLFTSASCGGSNQAEMIYMLLPDPTGAVNSNVRTQSFVYGGSGPTLVHHYEHLLNASRRLYFNGAAPLEQTWLDEGLAWELQELVFFNASAGPATAALTPRANIQLSTLTSGTDAAVRVAAFNTYENPMYGHMRNWFYQLNGSNANKRMGPLRQTAHSIGSVPNVHEVTSSNFAATFEFLRYALDRKNTGDAALLSSMVNTNLVGLANLQAMIGSDPTPWARDFLIASYVDDAGIVGVAPEYTLPSWNYRSVYGGLGGFPMSVNPLVDGTPHVFLAGPGGGTRFARFGIPAAGIATVVLTEGGVTPTSPITTAIVRTK